MKKASLITVIVLLPKLATLACTVCQKQQPKITRGITHGTGPQSDWDYVIVGTTALIVVISLVFFITWLINPGEHEKSHIKHSSFILE